jgi:hypothetical protein
LTAAYNHQDWIVPSLNDAHVDLTIEIVAEDAVDLGYCPSDWFEGAEVQIRDLGGVDGQGGNIRGGNPLVHIDSHPRTILRAAHVNNSLKQCWKDSQKPRWQHRLSSIGDGLLYVERDAIWKDAEIGDLYCSHTQIHVAMGVLVAHEVAHAVQHCFPEMASNTLGLDGLSPRQKGGHQLLWREIYRGLRKSWLNFALEIDPSDFNVWEADYLSPQARARLKRRTHQRVVDDWRRADEAYYDEF